MTRYLDLGLSLTEEQKAYFKNARDGRESYPNIGRYGKSIWVDVTALNDEETEYVNKEIVSKFKIKPFLISMISTPPNKFVNPHIDPPSSRRSSVVFPFYPDPPNYRPAYHHPSENEHDWWFEMEKIPYMGCYLFDTLTRHSITNNGYHRGNLQLWYRETYDELYDAHQKGEFLF